jgi:hypothetical protein
VCLAGPDGVRRNTDYNRAPLERALRSAVRSVAPTSPRRRRQVDDTEAVVRAFGPSVRYIAGEHRGAGLLATLIWLRPVI